jgi:SAM-dependent methyltransferase
MNQLKSLAKKKLGAKGIQILSSFAHFGLRHKCELCEARTSWRRDQGYGYGVLERLQVVGGLKRIGDGCPVCWSSSRTRLIYLYLLEKGMLAGHEHDVLHFAPERALAKKLIEKNGKRYVAADLDPSIYNLSAPVRSLDLTDLMLDDSSFDLVVCCHVLEHIEADHKAMAELYRVMRSGATGLFQVPIALKLDKTREGIVPINEAERIDLYGQRDHVRIYTAADYASRLRKAGFEVEEWWAYEKAPAMAQQLRVDPFERLFVCKKN